MSTRRLILFPPIVGILLIFALFFGAFQAVATERERITPENIDRLTEIASIGRGTVSGVFWGSQPNQMIVTTSEGFYIYNSENLSEHPHLIRTQRPLVYDTSPNKQFLLGRTTRSAYGPKHVRNDIWIWNLSTSELIATSVTLFPDDIDWPLNISATLFAPDTSYLLMFNNRGKVFRWDFTSRQPIEPIPFAWASAFRWELPRSFSPNGLYLAQCFYDGTVQIWNTSTWETVSVFRVIDADVRSYVGQCINFNQDSSELLARFQHNGFPGLDDNYSVLFAWSLDENRFLYKRKLPYNSIIGYDDNDIALALEAI